jgi:hypothetical protein
MKPKPHNIIRVFWQQHPTQAGCKCVAETLSFWFDPWVILLPVKLSCTHTHLAKSIKLTFSLAQI